MNRRRRKIKEVHLTRNCCDAVTSLAACSSDEDAEKTSADNESSQEAAPGDDVSKFKELLKTRYDENWPSSMGVGADDYDAWVNCAAEAGLVKAAANTSSLNVSVENAEAWAACVLPKIEDDLTDQDRNSILLGHTPVDEPANTKFYEASKECLDAAATAEKEANMPTDDKLQTGIRSLLDRAEAQEKLGVDSAVVDEIAQCMVAPLKEEVDDVDVLNTIANGDANLPIDVTRKFTSTMTDCGLEVMGQ